MGGIPAEEKEEKSFKGKGKEEKRVEMALTGKSCGSQTPSVESAIAFR